MRRPRAVALAGAALCLTRFALAEPPAGFDARVEELRAAVGVPGLSVAIVEDGSGSATPLRFVECVA